MAHTLRCTCAMKLSLAVVVAVALVACTASNDETPPEATEDELRLCRLFGSSSDLHRAEVTEREVVRHRERAPREPPGGLADEVRRRGQRPVSCPRDCRPRVT